MRARPRRVLLVGGGTVGHLAPGFALAEALEAHGVEAVFATPGEAVERAWFPREGPRPLRLPAPRLRRSPALLLYPFSLLAAVGRALAAEARVGAGAVVGLGGWPCVPSALAAALRRRPLAFLASDRTPGAAVGRLARRAGRVYVTDPAAARALGAHAGVVVTEPALRRRVREGRRDPGRFGLEADRATLLVLGGSLGAEALGRGVAEGLAEIASRRAEVGRRLQVIHSTGRRGAGVQDAYRRAGLPHHVVPFVSAMGDAYATADLVLSRAGAATCAELRAAGRPAVLVPYPHHADRQQYANADALVARGGALLLEQRDLSPRTLEDVVVALLLDAPRREAMARALGAGFRDGAPQIAADLVRWLGWDSADGPAERPPAPTGPSAACGG